MEKVKFGMMKYMRLVGLKIPASEILMSGVTGYEMLPNTENLFRKGFFAFSSPVLS
jgi:hypothetical protein